MEFGIWNFPDKATTFLVATANANGTVTLFDFSEIIGGQQ
jgi:hypothetical protein